MQACGRPHAHTKTPNPLQRRAPAALPSALTTPASAPAESSAESPRSRMAAVSPASEPVLDSVSRQGSSGSRSPGSVQYSPV